MTSEDVRILLRGLPFKPFTIRLIDGRAFTIRHPDFAWATPGRLRTLSVVDESRKTHVLNTTVIVSLELDPGAMATPTETEE